ncbi:MAG: EcsC family protein [Nocardioides sp.]
MGTASTTGRLVSQHVAPRLPHLAPDLTHSFVREALHRAIHGAGPLPPAAAAADKQVREQHGDVERGVREVIENHVRYAGAQGLLTGLGGVITATVTIPANVAGLALIQCRMIAGIAHLRGYDLEDSRVRNAILTCMLGREIVEERIKERALPGPAMAIATAPVHDPDLDRLLAAEVASDLITRVGGKRLAITIARRTPIVGGAFGMGADGFATWRVGRYAAGELRPRASR